MDFKKLKRTLIIILVAAIILVLCASFFGNAISDFIKGFITGVSFAMLVGAALVLRAKSKK